MTGSPVLPAHLSGRRQHHQRVIQKFDGANRLSICGMVVRNAPDPSTVSDKIEEVSPPLGDFQHVVDPQRLAVCQADESRGLGQC